MSEATDTETPTDRPSAATCGSPRVTALVTELRNLNRTYDELRWERDTLPRSLAFPDEDKMRLQLRIDRVCGDIMRTEQQIIVTLLGEAEALENSDYTDQLST